MDDIPATGIYYQDARIIVFQMITPDWQILEERLKPSPYYDEFPEQDAKVRANREAWRAYDKALRIADEWLRERIGRGILVALRRDPDTGQVLQLDRHKASMGGFETEIADVGRGARQPVYFDRKSFESVVKEIAQLTGISRPPVIDKGGRPLEYDWDAMKAFALELIRKLGKPHKSNKTLPSKAQLIEAIQREWSDRFDQHPSTSSLRSRLNQWLTEMNGN
jgi:hypothetical protein